MVWVVSEGYPTLLPMLVLLHHGHFDSLDLGYVGRLLDDAAGGAGGGVHLGQVGERHGGVDLPPVPLVFALCPRLLHASDHHSDGPGHTEEDECTLVRSGTCRGKQLAANKTSV